MKKLWVVALLMMPLQVGWSNEVLPAGTAGQVNLNWTTFNDLWSKIQSLEKTIEKLNQPDPEVLPPVPFTITKAAYRGTVGRKKVSMEGIYEISVLDKKNWVRIPFLPAGTALEEARLDGEPVSVVEANGFHELVLKNPGRHVLRIRFALAAPDPEQAPQLQFQVPSTPMTALALDFPQKNLDVKISPAQGIETTAAGSGTRVTASLPPTQYVDIRWQKTVPDEVAGPTKLYATTESLLTLSEGAARAHWRVNYTVLHRAVREVRLRMPEGWNLLGVVGESVHEWKMLEDEKGSVLAVQLAYAKKGTFSLDIQAERGLAEKEDAVTFARIVPLDVEREQGTIGVEAKGSLELETRESQGLQAIDPQELPGTLWQRATQPILFAFRYTKPHQLTIGLHRHPEVPVLTTTIDDANAVTLVTDRGQTITRIQYQVRNHLKQFLSIKLPAGAELWSAFVAGEPVKPTAVEGGEYRIPLARSQVQNGASGFTVDIVYYLPTARYAIIGHRTAMFPVPDAPVSRALWSLYLPHKYRFVHFGGDMEKGAQASPWRAVLGGLSMDKEEYLKDDRVESRRVTELSSLMEGIRGDAAAPAAKQAALERDVLANNKIQAAAGVFPVAFEVPSSGQLFSFGQVMIIGETPRVSMWYVHSYITGAIRWMMVLALLAFLVWRRREVLALGKKIAARVPRLKPTPVVENSL